MRAPDLALIRLVVVTVRLRLPALSAGRPGGVAPVLSEFCGEEGKRGRFLWRGGEAEPAPREQNLDWVVFF